MSPIKNEFSVFKRTPEQLGMFGSRVSGTSYLTNNIMKNQSFGDAIDQLIDILKKTTQASLVQLYSQELV